MAKQIVPLVGQSTKAERHAFWHEMLTLHKESGLKRQEFCQRHGLKVEDFRRWKYHLSKQEITRSLPPTASQAQPFIPLNISAADTTTPSAPLNKGSSGIQLVFPLCSGLEICLASEFSENTLARLLQVIGGLQ